MPSLQHFKKGTEIRIESVNKDNSHSWVRISFGMVKYAIDSVQDNTEIPSDPQEEQVPQTSTSVVAARSKAKAKTSTERTCWDINNETRSCFIRSLLHNQTLQREEDGAIEFCKTKFHLQNHHSQIQSWSGDRWKVCLAAGGGSKRRYQYCSDNLASII